FESGFADEEIQWQYLSEQLRQAQDCPVALFMHKPPCLTSFREDDYNTKVIPAQARSRLQQILHNSNVGLICCGHLHVYRTFHTLGMTVVVAPTIMRGANDYVSDNGHGVNGLVEYNFDGAGVEFRLREPPGVTRPHLPEGARVEWPIYLAESIDNG
ncbi:MAG: hypothetical protein KC547_07255, partial [Anaerolineae bacterium]|nr:hypothetical protein [Anaerolineae bacterium]